MSLCDLIIISHVFTCHPLYDTCIDGLGLSWFLRVLRMTFTQNEKKIANFILWTFVVPFKKDGQ